MHHEQHEKAAGARAGFEARHGKKGGVRAFGRIAFATIYTKEAGAKPKAQRDWFLEWRHPSGTWLTVKAPDQPKTFMGALNRCRGMEHAYRVVVRDAFGCYRPARAK